MCPSPVVGLDMQQKFMVYYSDTTLHYSAARSFGIEHSYDIGHAAAEQTPHPSTLKPLSSNQTATQKEKATPDKDQGNILQHFTDDFDDESKIV